MESDPFPVCEQIATAKNSTLVRTARTLRQPRYHFFLAVYAAMRMLDDYVDDTFLSMGDPDRHAHRRDAHARIQTWLTQMLGGRGDVLPGPVARAVRRTVGKSDLDPGIFRRFARSMASDVDELELRTWPDFLDYGEGATIAPSSVFIYVLACTPSDTGGRFRYHLPHPPGHYAGDMAVFCYLTHILRDLAVDVMRTRRLVTIPADILADVSLSMDRLRASVIAGEYEALEPLAARLLGHANEHLERGRRRTAGLRRFLGPDEDAALLRVYRVYEALRQEFERGYAGYLRRSIGIQRRLRESALQER